DAIECFSRHSRLPFTVMGGIKAEHIDVLVRLGARCIAVVTAISQAKDITCETSQLRERIIEARSRQING
ncbi:MAG TPA: thiamine phosphate synthase, partial [Desulfobulbaceae bacterium]|nr:thiamine phosphate synthase [Desulfobulbaceae bacterium]